MVREDIKVHQKKGIYHPYFRLVFVNKDAYLNQFKNVEIQGLFLDKKLNDKEAARMYSRRSYILVCRYC